MLSLSALLLPAVLLAAGPDDVIPFTWPDGAPPAVQPVRDRVYHAVQKQARHLLGQVHDWDGDPSLRLLTESRSGEHHVRPNTGALEGFAFLHRFGPYDEAVVGTSRPALLRDTILPMTRYLVATHVTGTRPTGDGKPWGDAWQSAHWTQMLGRAAWWTWPELPVDLRAAVRRVVAHEADRIAAGEPPHQESLDTKAEENAWNSQVLSVAILLMPADARRPGWEQAFQRWALSSFLRPADARSQAVVDGRTVADQFTGPNIHDDFTLENHNIVHPDYMTTFGLSLGCALDFAMTGRTPPEALLHNVAPVYENLKWFVLPDGGFVYPSGQDWELFRNPGWFNTHVLMATFGRDPEAWPLALTALDTLERMQARTASGAVYDEGSYFFASTQTDLLRALARSWLELRLAHPPGEFKPRHGVLRLDSGKILLNRTPTAIHTLSWGPTVMAQCVPFRLDRIVSPDPRNGIGHVRLEGQERPSKVVLREARVDSASDRFQADLVLDHADAHVRAELQFRSDPDGRWTIRETLTALDDITTAEVATGLVGILNNSRWIHERGRRTIRLGAEETEVASGSGATRSALADTASVDAVLRIQSPAPLHLRYESAPKPERGRTTDRLYLNALDSPHSWRRGQTLSHFEATLECATP